MIILWWRKNEGGRFKLVNDWNFLLRNQQLPSHLIQLGSFLPLEFHIMGQELNLGSHDWK